MILTPLVSIIIPCWNAEQFVAEAIESALAQFYPNNEVIVIDDGSTDCSLDVIKSFGEKVRWETGPNRGACVARNRGLAIARGELIQFLDADDVLLPSKLINQVSMMKMARDQSVFGWYEHVSVAQNSDVKCWKPDIFLLDDSVILALQHIIQTEPPLHWIENVRSIGGFDEMLPCNQDYDFNLRLACSGTRFVYDDHQSSQNYRRKGSVSADECRRHRYMPGILERAYGMLEQQGALTERRRKVIAHRLAVVARSLINFSEYRLARRTIRLAKEIHPGGGIQTAYDNKSRLVRNLVGPIIAENCISFFRRFSGQKRRVNNSKL